MVGPPFGTVTQTPVKANISVWMGEQFKSGSQSKTRKPFTGAGRHTLTFRRTLVMPDAKHWNKSRKSLHLCSNRSPNETAARGIAVSLSQFHYPSDEGAMLTD